MNQKNRLIAFGSIILLLLGCASEELFQKQHFIFGEFENTCQKDCTKLIKLEENTKLLLDADVLLTESINFSAESLSLRYVERVRWLEKNVPSFIKNKPSGDIFAPNVTRKPAYYIEIQTRDTKSFWRIDSDPFKYSDPEMKQYLDSIRVITALF